MYTFSICVEFGKNRKLCFHLKPLAGKDVNIRNKKSVALHSICFCIVEAKILFYIWNEFRRIIVTKSSKHLCEISGTLAVNEFNKFEGLS